MVTEQSHLNALSQAKDQRLHWMDVADAFKALETGTLRAPDGRTWLNVASEASRLSANQLRRMARARAFVIEVESQRPGSEKRLRAIPFAHVEVLAKLWALDRTSAQLLIDQAHPKRFTYLGLLEEYQLRRSKASGRASPMAAGKHAAQEFIRTCGDLLLENPVLTGGEDQRTILRPTNGFKYTNPDYVIRDLSQPSHPILEAVDCYFVSSKAQRDALRRKMAQIAFESTFFKRFWCLIPSAELSGEFHLACDELGFRNVGLVIVDAARHTLTVDRQPSADPVPDRTRLIFSDWGFTKLRPHVARAKS
jgi:hypothetical protein